MIPKAFINNDGLTGLTVKNMLIPPIKSTKNRKKAAKTAKKRKTKKIENVASYRRSMNLIF
jgi:hypothetical protein